MSTYDKPFPINGHSNTFVDIESFHDLQEDEMPTRTRAEQDEKLAEIIETQNQLLMWLKTKEIAGNDKRVGITPVVGIIISAIALLVGIAGGLLGSVAGNAQWKGDIEARIKIIEIQRSEDKKDFIDQVKYVQTQNEVAGKTMARIEARLESDDRRKGR